MKRKPGSTYYRPMVLRVYLVSVGSILLSALLVAGAARFVLDQPWKTDIKTMASHLVDTVAAAQTKAAMQLEAQRIARDLGAQVSLFDQHGAPLFSTVTPGAAPLPASGQERLQREGAFSFSSPPQMAVPLRLGPARGGYAVLRPPSPSISALEAGLALGLFLVCFAGTSLVFGRLLSHPLAELGQAARAFGAGNLGARVRLDRHDEFGALARVFNDMADQLKSLLRSQKELIANISHELRTPLSRIRFALELMADGDAASAQRFVGEITRDLAELERLVGDILTTARLELDTDHVDEARPPLRLEPTHPDGLMDEAAERFRTMHPGHRLVLAIEGSLAPVDADGPLLRRAIDNLLDNASKYSDPGSEVRLVARTLADELEVEVIDHGIGIDPPDLNKVFDPFFRTDRSRARTSGGIGLGLPLVRRIVRAHGGEIDLHSTAGAGTRVRFSIPLHHDLPPPALARAEPVAQPVVRPV